MILITVLLGYALLPDWSSFAERPPALQFSLQSDSTEEGGMEKAADLSRSMNVHSRGIFVTAHSNVSSFVEMRTQPPEDPQEDRECGERQTYEKDGVSKLCCEATDEVSFEKGLTALHNFQPVMTMTHLGADCRCLCGGLGRWGAGSAALATGEGIVDASYQAVDVKPEHAIKDGKMVRWSQLHVLAHANVLRGKLGEWTAKIEPPPGMDEEPALSRKFAEFKTKALDFWKDYEFQAEGVNLGTWNKNVETLIQGIDEWGRDENNLPKVRPRKNTPVLGYQLEKLRAKSIEPGKIDMCIEGRKWKEDDGGDPAIPLSEFVNELNIGDWGPDGAPVVGGKVTLSQEGKVSAEHSDKVGRMNSYIEGRTIHDELNMDVENDNHNLKDHVFANFHFVPRERIKDACDEDQPCFQQKLEAETLCKATLACCGLTAEFEQPTMEQEIAYPSNRRAPPEEDITTIEVAMNFQGRLAREPRIWTGAATGVQEAVEYYSGYSCGTLSPPSPCHCGCKDGLCYDPFNSRPPMEDHLVTAEQAAVYYYYYQKDIMRDTNKAHVGKHWTWLPLGLTYLAKNHFDLPGADPTDIDSPGPREGEPVTPYQLHYLLTQTGRAFTTAGGADNIAQALADKLYISKGSEGLKPCDTKQVDANRFNARVDEDQLILNKNRIKTGEGASEKDFSHDAPMIQDKDWLYRADDINKETGIINGAIKNKDPHNGTDEQPTRIPKTMAYADILHELRNQEQLRKERFFKEEIPYYWLRGYHAWKLNQDVRELENQYFKNLYITSNAAARIVKKEYDVDNRLTDDVSRIIEAEAARPGITKEEVEGKTKLFHFHDHDEVSRFGQAQALHHAKLLAKKEMNDKELQNTLAIIDEHDARSIAEKQMTAPLPGERVMLKYSNSVKLKLKSRPEALAPYFPTGDEVTEDDLAQYTFVLGGYRIVKTGPGNVIDCKFDRDGENAPVRIYSQFHKCLTYDSRNLADGGVTLEPYSKGRPVVEFERSQEFFIEPLKRWGNIPKLEKLDGHFKGGEDGMTPKPGLPVSKVQIDHLKEGTRGIAEWRNEVCRDTDIDTCLAGMQVASDHDKLYAIRVVLANKAEKKLYLSWEGSGNFAKKLSGRVNVADVATPFNSPGRYEMWSIVDDGNGGLGIMAYDPGDINWEDATSFNRRGLERSSMVDDHGVANVKGAGVIQPWIIVDDRTTSPVCKVSIDLQVPRTSSQLAADTERTGKLSLHTKFGGPFLDSIEPQDLVNVISGKPTEGNAYEIRPLGRILQYVQLPIDPPVSETNVPAFNKRKAQIEALANFLRGPWIIKHNTNNAFGVQLENKEELILDSKTISERTLLSEMKYNAIPIWSTAGRIDLKDLLPQSKTYCGGGEEDTEDCATAYTNARKTTATGIDLIKHIRQSFCDNPTYCGGQNQDFRDTCSPCCLPPCQGNPALDYETLSSALESARQHKMLLDSNRSETLQYKKKAEDAIKKVLQKPTVVGPDGVSQKPGYTKEELLQVLRDNTEPRGKLPETNNVVIEGNKQLHAFDAS